MKSVNQIMIRLNELTVLADERSRKGDGLFAALLGGASMDFMTKEELAERHELMLALPTMAEEREAARQRIQERIRNRRKRSEVGV